MYIYIINSFFKNDDNLSLVNKKPDTYKINYPYIYSDHQLNNTETILDSNNKMNIISLSEFHLPKPEKLWFSNWDGMESSNCNATHTIILIRHGQYHKDGYNNFGLTSKGREQIDKCGLYLKQYFKNKKTILNKVYYSTLQRAMDSFDIIDKHLGDDFKYKALKTSDIKECKACPNEPNQLKWYKSNVDLFKNNLKAEKAFKNYIHRAEDKFKKDYTTVLVCHGNLIRYILLRVLQLDPTAWMRLYVPLASISTIKIFPDGNIRLDCIGSRAYYI